MKLIHVLLAHSAAVLLVTLMLFAGVLFDAGTTYRNMAVFGLLPVFFLVVYAVSIAPVIFVRHFAERYGKVSYRHAVTLGACLGSLLYSSFAALLNGREILAEPTLAITVIASGVGLGAVGGFTYLLVERRLQRGAQDMGLGS